MTPSDPSQSKSETLRDRVPGLPSDDEIHSLAALVGANFIPRDAMPSLPTDTTDKTAIDAEKIRDRDYDGWDDALELAEAILKASGSSLRHYEAHSKDRIGIAAFLAIQAAKSEGDHFLRHFTKLAKVNAAANAALDTARQEWAKRGEG